MHVWVWDTNLQWLIYSPRPLSLYELLFITIWAFTSFLNHQLVNNTLLHFWPIGVIKSLFSSFVTIFPNPFDTLSKASFIHITTHPLPKYIMCKSWKPSAFITQILSVFVKDWHFLGITDGFRTKGYTVLDNEANIHYNVTPSMVGSPEWITWEHEEEAMERCNSILASLFTQDTSTFSMAVCSMCTKTQAKTPFMSCVLVW